MTMPAGLLLRPYTGPDWSAVRDIHDLCKPDEIHGSVDPSAILPFGQRLGDRQHVV